jgi:NitT/TauT family transport system substrate-binding protein
MQPDAACPDPRWRPAAWRATAVLVLGSLLATCTPPPARAPTPADGAVAEAASASPASLPPAPLQKLSIMGSNITYAQFAFPLAREAGLFERYGLDVDVTFGPRTVAALLSGDVQLATGAEDVIVANLGGSDTIIIAVMVPYIQHRVMVRPEIRTMADLRDKAVGVSKRGTLPYTVLSLAARRNGLEIDRDLIVMEVGDTATQIAALVSGNIHALALVPPATDIVAERAGAYALYDFSREGIEYAVASVATTREWAARNEAAVLNVLRALAEAIYLVHTRPAYAAEVFAQWAKTDLEAGRTAVALAQEIVALKMLPTTEGIGRVLETVSYNVPAAATADPTRFFDDRYIRQLEAEGFYERLTARAP